MDEYEQMFGALFCIVSAIFQTVNASGFLGDIKRAMVGVRKFFDIIDAPVEKRIRDNGAEFITEIGDIEFQNVVFGYNNDRDVLKGINLKIEKNKFNAFCG